MPSSRIDAITPVVRAVCEAVDSPRALAVWLCFQHNPAALVELPPPHPAENNTSCFAGDYFVSEFLSKFKDMKTGVDLRRVALSRWKASETLCAATNQRFRELRVLPSTGSVERTLFRARRKIASLLGPLDVAKALSDCRWGPGATFDIRRVNSHPVNKMHPPFSCTERAAPYFRAVLESDPTWISGLGAEVGGRYSVLPELIRVVRGSRFTTVAKSAKTDRCIAIEPTANSFLQQGVSSYIRRRLRRFGVDLDDQSINQKCALEAYTEGLSTLDLSAASDTVSTELVYDLLPLDWAFFLDALRSPETLVDGGWIRTEKFASMGNAFCFELETLIFWALAGSVDGFQEGVDRLVTYGDDVIVSRRHFQQVVDIFTFCGFQVNSRKSFREGNFFESCGKHYHRGFDVTPAYQKEPVTTPSELIRLHNRLWRLEARLKAEGITLDLSRARRALRNAYPLRPFPRIPEGAIEDGGFMTPERDLPLDLNHGYRCVVLDYVPSRRSDEREGVLLAYKLRRPEQQNETREGYVAVTQGVGKWRTRVRYVPLHNVMKSL